MDGKPTVVARRLKVVLVLLAGLAVVLTVLGLLGLVIWVLPPQLVQGQLAKNTTITDADRLKAINDVRGALLTGLGVLAVLSGSLVAYLNFRSTLELNRRGQVTDRFGKAVDQLGKAEQLDVRIPQGQPPGGRPSRCSWIDSGAARFSELRQRNKAPAWSDDQREARCRPRPQGK